MANLFLCRCNSHLSHGSGSQPIPQATPGSTTPFGQRRTGRSMVFHFYASVPIHIAVPATDLFATEQFYIQELQPSLNFGFIERHFRPRTGFIRQLDFSQSRHMGFATIWRKRRRLRLPIALQQAFLAKRMSNRLDLWRLLGDLGSNTLRRFDAIRYIRSRDFPHAALSSHRCVLA